MRHKPQEKDDMHCSNRIRGLLMAGLMVVVAAGSGLAQQIRFTDFSSFANLQPNGSAFQAQWNSKQVLRLSRGALGGSDASSIYSTFKQPVASGFTTYFSFQMHNPTTPTGPAEGISFIIQNAASTDSSMGASGHGLTALGGGARSNAYGGMGYTGIPNSLAVELDIRQNSDVNGHQWDPSSNHVAVQSCGTASNTPIHLPGTFTIGTNTNAHSCLVNPNAITSNINQLAGTCNGQFCTDGSVHFVVVDYTTPGVNQTGTLKVWVDPTFIQNTHTPSSPPNINIPYNISTSLSLDTSNGVGAAWVGFTASQSDRKTTQDVFEWEFTPHTPLAVQKLIPNDGSTNDFIFGGHVSKVTYQAGINPNGLFMTILATPIDRSTFHQTRLAGTPFAGEQCIVYLETGGNCIVYSVTCQLNDMVTQTPCPTQQVPPIALATAYYTSDPVNTNNADYLKADPIGTNNWISICNPPNTQPPCFQPNVFDGTTSGSGHDLSDLVATFAQPVGPVQSPVAEEPKPAVIEPRRATKP